MRMAARPDGSKGFSIGRGRGRGDSGPGTPGSQTPTEPYASSRPGSAGDAEPATSQLAERYGQPAADVPQQAPPPEAAPSAGLQLLQRLKSSGGAGPAAPADVAPPPLPYTSVVPQGGSMG